MARTLKIFMRGKSVTQLQEILRRMGYTIEDQRGIFGVHTRDAVKSFQKQQGLTPTGHVDDDLMQMLQGGAPVQASDSDIATPESQTSPVYKQELDALVRLLIQKKVFTQEEWDAEMKRAVPSSLV